MNLLDMLGPMLTGRQGALAMPRMRAMGFDTEGMQQRAQRTAMGSLASSLLGASGWSSTPVSLGQALGQGMQGAQQSYGDAIRNEIEMAQMIRQEEAAFAAARREEMLEKAFADPAVAGMLPPELRGVLPFLGNTERVQMLQEILKQRGKPAKPPETREIKIGDEVVTQEFDPATGSWRELGRGARFAPPAQTSVNAFDPNAVPLDMARFEAQLRGEFAKVNEGAASAISNYQKLKTALSVPGGIGDVTALYSYISALDPASTVREGEIDLVRSAAGLYDQLTLYGNNLRRGDSLTPQIRDDMLRLAGGIAQTAQQNLERRRTQYQKLVDSHNNRGLNLDPYAVVGDAPQPPPPPPQGANTLSELFQQIRNSRFGRNASRYLGGQ